MSNLKLALDWVEKNIIKRFRPYYRFVAFIAQLVFWIVLTFLLTPVSGALFKSIFHKDVGLSDFILLITAAFIIFYTYETQKMRKQMESSKEAEFMPILAFSSNGLQRTYFVASNWAENKDRIFALNVMNVGKGIAKGVTVYMNGYRVSTHVSIQVDHEEHMLVIRVAQLPEALIKKIGNKIDKITLQLEYRDIYDNQFSTETTFDKKDTGYKINEEWNFNQF